MLFALYLRKRPAFFGRQPAGCEGSRDYSRLVFEDFCHDRLAHGLRAGAQAAGGRSRQAAKPVHFQSEFDHAVRGSRRHARADGFRRYDARRIRAAPRTHPRGPARDSGYHMRHAAGRFLCFPQHRRSFERANARRRGGREATPRTRARRRGSRRALRRSGPFADFLRHFHGANRRRPAAACTLLRPCHVSLCPARLEPIFSPRLWGALSLAPFFPEKFNLAEPLGEAWMTGNECRFASGPFAGKKLGEAWREMPPEWAGTRADRRAAFPLLIKFIFTEEKLSV